MLQLEAAYSRFSPSGAPPGRNRRLQQTRLVLAVLVIINLVWLGILLSRAPGERAVESASTQSATPSGFSSSAGPSPTSDPRNGSAEGETIQVEEVADSARPFQTVRNPGYVPRWSRHISAGAALRGRQVAGLPATHQDQPVRRVHRLCRVWEAGSLPAARAGSQLRRDVQTLCPNDQGLTHVWVISHEVRAPPPAWRRR
jgi:hypothetical protein